MSFATHLRPPMVNVKGGRVTLPRSHRNPPHRISYASTLPSFAISKGLVAAEHYARYLEETAATPFGVMLSLRNGKVLDIVRGATSGATNAAANLAIERLGGAHPQIVRSAATLLSPTVHDWQERIRAEVTAAACEIFAEPDPLQDDANAAAGITPPIWIEQRIAQLTDPAYPAIMVSRVEAMGFAHYVGAELPTLVHWHWLALEGKPLARNEREEQRGMEGLVARKAGLATFPSHRGSQRVIHEWTSDTYAGDYTNNRKTQMPVDGSSPRQFSVFGLNQAGVHIRPFGDGDVARDNIGFRILTVLNPS